ELPQYNARIKEKVATLQGTEQGVVGRLLTLFQEITDEIQRSGPPATEPDAANHPIPLVVKTEPTVTPGTIAGIAIPLLEGLASVALVIVLLVFMLMMREDLRDRVLYLIGHGRLTSATRAMDDAGHRLSRFLLMQTLTNLVFGALVSLGLFLIGIP